jgi:catechol 2,3-dioxygenase-like lactoylglutathione lyase family enzyme
VDRETFAFSGDPRRVTVMIKSFNHSSVTVSDLSNSIEFYAKFFGLEVISHAERPQEYTEKVTGIDGCYLKIAHLRGFGHILELIEYVGSTKKCNRSESDNIGAGHICFNVDDLQAMVEQFTNLGVDVLGNPIRIPAGINKGGLVVYISDPDGIIVELIEPPR